MYILGQRRLGLDTSSIPSNDTPAESPTGQSSNRMEYPSTPKQFKLFQEYKNVEHNGNMLSADQRTKVYEDRSKVIAEMAKAFYIFSRSIFFNLEMADQYNLSRDKYFNCKRIGWVHKDIGYYFIKSINLFKLGTTRYHGTRIARGVPLPVYINLDLYSGFWCTSRCVVFKYSVPPLTDQALRKVLLTS